MGSDCNCHDYNCSVLTLHAAMELWSFEFYCNSCHFTNCLKIVTSGYSGKLFLVLHLDKEKLCHGKGADFMDT